MTLLSAPTSVAEPPTVALSVVLHAQRGPNGPPARALPAARTAWTIQALPHAEDHLRSTAQRMNSGRAARRELVSVHPIITRDPPAHSFFAQ